MRKTAHCPQRGRRPFQANPVHIHSTPRHGLGVASKVQGCARCPAKRLAEEEFLNLVMAHFLTSWRIAKVGGIITLKELAADVQEFFNLPLPRAVWEKTKAFRNQRFVKFVEHALM